jgi:hypothetical protein
VTPRRTAEAILWQAAYERRLLQATAWQTLSRGLAYYQTYTLPLAANYYSALCDYYEQDGQPAQALALRHEQVKVAPDLGSVSYIVESHIDLCRLLGRMGQPIDDAIKQAHELTSACLKPTIYLERLQRIENGDYYQFDWQRKNLNGKRPE